MSYFDEIECPYCGYTHDMSEYEFEGNDEIDIECQNTECEKEFMVTVEWSPSYSASEITYEICSCGEKVRTEDMYRSGGKFVCRKCFFKNEIERLKQ